LPERGKDQHLIAVWQGSNGFHHVRGIVFLHQLAGNRGISPACAGKQQAEIIIDLGHTAHRGPGSAGDHLLLDGDGRTKTFNIVYIRFVHTSHELPGIGAKTFRITPLPFREQSIDSKGGFPRPGHTRDDHELSPGDGNVDIFKIVDPGSFNKDGVTL